MRIAHVLLMPTLLALPALALEGEAAADRARPGLLLDLAEVDRVASMEGPPAVAGVPVRLVLRADGAATDWAVVERAVDALRAAGWAPSLCLTGDRLPSALEPGQLEAWRGFARTAVRRFSDRVSLFEVWDRPLVDGGVDLELYAFVLKTTAIAMRAEAETLGRSILVAQGAVAIGGLERQQALWALDTAAYVDVLPLAVPAGAGLDGLARWKTALLERPPSPAVWLQLHDGADLVGRTAAALADGVRIASIALPGDPAAAEERARWIGGFDEALSAGFAPAPIGSLEVLSVDGRRLEGARLWGRFLNENDFTTLLVYDLAATSLAEDDEARLSLGSANVKDGHFVDPVERRQMRTGFARMPGDETRRALRLRARPYPAIATFRRIVAQPEGLETRTEALEVERTRGLTAEEIIARYRQVQQAQDDRLDRWIAEGRTDLHYSFPGGGSIDLTIDTRYFWERGAELEWEQTDYYINGNRLNWKKIPELPLIQPEKVVTLPLDLTLDRSYAYRLVGEENVDGRPAYVLSFRPTGESSGRSLYRGRIWIDRETFVRLRASLIQTDLVAPVLSNEEVDRYTEVQSGDARFWMLTEVTGQQLWTAGGRNLVVQREISFRDFVINPEPEAFEAARRQAYASDHQMIRDTAQGFRYLERQGNGERTVKQDVDTGQLFVAAGAFRDESTDGVVPLAGIDYFNYDWLGKGVQMNTFFAGVLAAFTATKPDLFGAKVDLTGEAALFGLKTNDKVFDGEDELLGQRIDVRSQIVSARLGLPMGNFFKLTLIGSMQFNEYFEDEDARDFLAPAGLAMQLPVDHRRLTGRLQLEFNRRGYSVTAGGSWSSRSEWEPWGVVDVSTGAFDFTEFDPSHKSYARYGVGVGKEWFLPRFQKIRVGADWLDGDDLDRFSRYRFSQFGDTELAGFSGSGVRFDRGALARVAYAFNLFNVIRLGASVEHATVEDLTRGLGREQFTGVGVSGNFVGPWKTVYRVSYGRSIASDIPDLEGRNEFLLVVLKLF